ncbi:hypothetical protein ANACOL_00878 [Anaerotruncus colihominis DSM 17241]|uniref:Uncharacterized protein n=1 Tax=Anaerotruncus colihominis DSM 17241 TaxID=445972 RepID=B0P7Y9_9FIRM|nr:hypothetical protein ANACOL_00878 [Anaerotruncus colihominis DSM 17241]
MSFDKKKCTYLGNLTNYPCQIIHKHNPGSRESRCGKRCTFCHTLLFFMFVLPRKN